MGRRSAGAFDNRPSHPWVLSGSFNPRLLSVLAATSLPYLLADFALMKTVTVHYYVIAPPLLLTAVCQQRPVLTEQRRQWWVAGVMIGVLGGPLVTGLYGPASREVIYPTLRSIHANQQVIQATHDAISCLPEGATIATTSTVTPLVAHLRRVVILLIPLSRSPCLQSPGLHSSHLMRPLRHRSSSLAKPFPIC